MYFFFREDFFVKVEEFEEGIPVTFDGDSINAIEVYEACDENVETSVVVHEIIEGFEDGQFIAYVGDDYVGSSVEIIDEEIKEEDEMEESEDDSKPYICEDCGNVFKSLPAFRIHLRQHQQGGQRCNYCDAAFLTVDLLQQHMEIVHQSFAVPTKQKKFNPYAKTFLCNTCGKILKSSIAYENHTLKHQSKTPYPCSLCSDKFPNKGARRKHEVKDHQLFAKANGNPDGYHVCEICGLEMFSDGAYYHHKDKHGDPYPCPFCGKLYGSRSLMQVHARRHTNERPHMCTICRRSFKVKQELCAHMNTHKDIRPYQCPHCPKMCRKSSDLTHHIRTHTGEKPFICDQCGRGFAQAGDMRKHRLLHNRALKTNKISVS